MTTVDGDPTPRARRNRAGTFTTLAAFTAGRACLAAWLGGSAVSVGRAAPARGPAGVAAAALAGATGTDVALGVAVALGADAGVSSVAPDDDADAAGTSSAVLFAMNDTVNVSVGFCTSGRMASSSVVPSASPDA